MSEKHTLSELDAGQLELMWQFLQLGKLEPDAEDIERLIEYTDKVRQALVQKTAGQREGDKEKGYVHWGDLGTYINLIVIECLTLRISGVFDKMLEAMRNEQADL